MLGLALSPLQRQSLRAAAFDSHPVLWIDTMNQLLESISTRRIDRLLLDPVWMDEPVWWPAVLQALAMTEIPWSMLLATSTNCQIWDLESQPHELSPKPWPFCLTVASDGQCRHQNGRVLLSPQQRAVLEIMAMNPNQIMSLEHLNQARAIRGDPPMSGASLRVQLHGIRKLVGSEHVQTIRRLGYRWRNCSGE